MMVKFLPKLNLRRFETPRLLFRGVDRRPLYLGIGSMFLSSLFDGLTIALLIPFLKLVLGEIDTFTLPDLGWTASLNQWLQAQGKDTTVGLCTIVLVCSLCLKAYFFFTAKEQTTGYEEAATHALRRRLFTNYLYAPTRFYDTTKLGTITNNLQMEVVYVGNTLGYASVCMISVLTLLAYIATLLVVSWKLTLVIVVLISVIAYAMSLYLRSLRKYGDRVIELGRVLSVRILETLSGIRVVKAFGTEKFEQERFSAFSNEYRTARMELRAKQHVVEPLTELATLGSGMLILAGAYVFLIQQGLLNTAELMLFMLVLIRSVPVTRRINNARGYILENLSAFAKVAEGLRLAEQFPPATGHLPFEGLARAIRFRQVGFSYNGRSEVLRDFDLEVPQGQTVALVGSSGAGKSTVASLLPRFYEVTSGSIEIDGLDIRELDPISLRHHIGIVSQDTYIFNATVFENIAYGLPEATPEQVREAALLANAHEFIQHLPEGYQTFVGDRGVQLSGGQRQRLSIARTLLRNPEILILDEATSALDSQSEALVQEAIERLRFNRTVIVIAHRLSTVRNADKIVVMEKGRIVEAGEHAQLLAQRGAYWSFHNLQTVAR
ncbi:HlyB/MsbA family ABC transporter [Gloeobacter violaceus PCC 7421]|uniref:HlyB/MsbA family ABC transporter n=2 Tax=Gloeobacter violaceus TaxID=33072 RepID=Q7NII7_GLOVI|nr:HlyB/MsbA family ABC transporter [Gloeobacter violaceus PCC 7421]